MAKDTKKADAKKADAKAKAAEKLKQAKAKEREKAAEKLKAVKGRAKTAEKELKSMSRTRAKEADKLKAAKDRAKKAEKDLKAMSKTRAKEMQRLQQDPTAAQSKVIIDDGAGATAKKKAPAAPQAGKLAATRSESIGATDAAAVTSVRPATADADLGTRAESSPKTEDDGQTYAAPVKTTSRTATTRTPRTAAARKPAATRTTRTPRRTGSDTTSPSRTDLLRQASEKGIVGRHRMSREQLEQALKAPTSTPSA